MGPKRNTRLSDIRPKLPSRPPGIKLLMLQLLRPIDYPWPEGE